MEIHKNEGYLWNLKREGKRLGLEKFKNKDCTDGDMTCVVVIN